MKKQQSFKKHKLKFDFFHKAAKMYSSTAFSKVFQFKNNSNQTSNSSTKIHKKKQQKRYIIYMLHYFLTANLNTNFTITTIFLS